MNRTVAALLACAALAYAQPRPPDYAIVNARIVVSPEKTIPTGTILIRNGLIDRVTDEAPPPEARVFDAKGLTVYPGLIDAASHYGFPSTPPRPAAAPPAATPATPPSVPDDIASPWRYLRPDAAGVNAETAAASRISIPSQPDARRNEGFTAVLAIPRGGIWQGASALVQLGDGPLGNAIISPRVAMHVSFSAQGGPFVGSRRYPNSLMGVFSVLRQSLIRAQQYRDAIRLYEENGRRGVPRPAFDAVSDALLPVLDGSLRVAFTASSAQEIRRALRFAEEFNLKPIIVGGSEAWRVADVLKTKNIPVLVDIALNPPQPNQPANSSDRVAAESNPGKLEGAGVAFALVTSGSDRLDQIRQRLNVAIARGLSQAGALRALTLSPAEILGAGSQLGTIEPGKIANLTLVEGDLLSATSRVRAVLIDGALHYPAPRRQPPVRTAQNAPATGQQQQQQQQPTTPDDPTPVAPRAATPPDTSASPLPARRPPEPEPAPKNLVIRNATLLTITKGTIPNGSIWIQDGKIRAVGATVNAPSDAVVIDGSGRFIMPGIVDSHSHTATSGGVNESGVSVTAMVRIQDVLDPEDVNIYRAAAGGTTTLNILHGSANVIGGQNAVIKTKWGHSADAMLFPGAPRGIKMALGENPKRAGQMNASRFPATRMGVENVVRESFRNAREYARQWDDYQARAAKGEKVIAPERNLTLEVLADILAGKVLVHAHCYRADEISMLLDVADEFGFKIRSLQHVLEGYKVTEKIRKHGAGASTFADFWGYKMEAYDGTAYNAAMMVKAGIRTALNSDSNERARRLYQEAAKALKYGGLTEEQALRLITTEPAWMLGVENRVGALEPGMDADLAIFNAHPFSPYARVEMTVIDGQIVFDRERDIKQRVPWKEEFEPDTPLPSGGADSEEEEIH